MPDLDMTQNFYKYNRRGTLNGHNAFSTREHADRQEYLKMERQVTGLSF